MSHCDDFLLSRYIDGETTRDEARQLILHLKTCDTCRRSLESLRMLDSLSREILPPRRFSVEKACFQAKRRRRIPALLAAAAVAVFCALGYAAVNKWFAATPDDTTTPVMTAPVASQDGEETGLTSFEAAPEDRANATNVQGTDRPAPVEAPPTTGRVITGHVVNMAGAPIAGAQVKTRSTVRTDENGRFEIPMEGDLLSAEAEGYAPTLLHCQLASLSPSASVNITVRLFNNVGQWSGTVTDAAGVPVAGVAVRQWYRSGQVMPKPTKTDEQGRFSVPLSPYVWNVVEFSHSDFANLLVNTATWVTTERIVLANGGNLRITATRDNKPVAGQRITLEADELPGDPAATTDIDGIAFFQHLPAGIAISPSVGEESPFRFPAVRIAADQTVDTHLKLDSKSLGELEGLVVDADGTPVPGVKIWLADIEIPSRRFTVTTGKDGAFEARLLWPRVRATVDPKSLAAIRPGQTVAQPSSADFTLSTPGQKLTHRFQTKPDTRPVQRVRLVGADGGMVKRVLAVARQRSSDGAFFLMHSQGDADFQIDTQDGWVEVGRGGYQIVAFDPDTGLMGSLEADESSAAPVDLRLTQRAAAIEGTVVDHQGKSLAYAVVGASRRGAQLRACTQADAEGRFRIFPVPADDTVTLEFQYPGYVFTDFALYQSVKAGGAPLRVTLTSADARLSGKVVQDDGKPVPGARIEAQHETGRTFEVCADASGAFNLKLLPGAVYLTATSCDTGLRSGRQEVNAPATGLVLTVPAFNAGPNGPEYEEACNTFKQMGLIFKMFAAEHRGEFPSMAAQKGVFWPDFSLLYPEYVTDTRVIDRLIGFFGVNSCYLGHLVTDDTNALAFLDAYEQNGPEVLAGETVEVPEGTGINGGALMYPIKEGVERFVVTDINNPAAGAIAQSQIPVLWEIPGSRDVSGGYVLYMDGHVEWVDYPGKFPMTETFVQRINSMRVNEAG